MAFVTLLSAGLVKVAYKFAEDKKWLPGFVYENLSLQKLDEGDLLKAQYFNKISIRKNPDSPRALITRDLIAMHHDANIERLLVQVHEHQYSIKKLQEEIQANQKRLEKNRIHNIIVKALLPLVMLAILAIGLILIQTNHVLNKTLTLGVFILMIIVLSGYYYANKFLIRPGVIEKEINMQEIEITFETFRREINLRKRKILELDQQINVIKRHATENRIDEIN